MMPAPEIPAFQLYGEAVAFPDILHMEQIRDRAAGLDWTIKPHRHTQLLQVFMLFSGQIMFQVDGRASRLIPPVVLSLPPGCVHGFQFSSDTEGWVISLPVQHYSDLLGDGAELAPALSGPLALPPPAQMEHEVSALWRVWQGRGPFRRTALRCRMGLMLTDLLRDAAAPDSAAPDAGSPDRRLARFQALIVAHASQNWPIERYAARLGLSDRTLGRICKAQTGLSPRALIEAHLMREASRLLAYTQMSAKSVAHALGFEDASYFSRRFRAFSGLSPRAYRNRLDQP